MKQLFDQLSGACSRETTKKYSTSFSLATRLLSPSIRQDIYNIYGFVRFADEIVDSFHEYDKEFLLDKFEADLKEAVEQKISLNPILNAFQETVHKYGIGEELYMTFLKSMRQDLHKTEYFSRLEFEEYIYGSANVVGLMCLKVFVKGDQKKYDELKTEAMALGSAFQKVNFLRDLKNDYENLERSYFPNVNFENPDETTKQCLVSEIESDFKKALKGILKLPVEAKQGVYTAYVYYLCLLKKLKKTPLLEIRKQRVRVPNYQKAGLLAKSYVSYRLNLIESH